MLTFREYHALPILDMVKTETRRLVKDHGRRPAAPDTVHTAQVSRFRPSTAFADLDVVEVWQEELDAVTDREAYAEGAYPNANAYKEAFYEINHLPAGSNPDVWVVRFKLRAILAYGRQLIDERYRARQASLMDGPKSDLFGW